MLLPRSFRLPSLIIPTNSRRWFHPSAILTEHEEETERHHSDLLQRCARNHDLKLGIAIHGRLLKIPILSSSLFLQNHLVNMYFKCCQAPSLPLQLFDEMPHRNVVSWSAAVAGLVQSNHHEKALAIFSLMQKDGVRPNEFTLVSALNASSLTHESATRAPQIYGQVIRLGFESNVFLVNAFLTALIRNGGLANAAEIFEKCGNRDIVSWNSMIAGYSQFSQSEVWEFWCRMNREGVSFDGFSLSSVLTGLAASSSLKNGEQVQCQLVKYGFQGDICVMNSLVDLYLKNQDLASGFKAFDEMSERDVVSWTQMSAGCLHCGQPMKALEIVDQMRLCGVEPNKFTLATMVNACSNLASVEEGKKAHGFRIKRGCDMDVCVDNALIDMYAKCGSMGDARRVFRSMKERSVITWTTMIMGFTQNGLAREAIVLFDGMILERVVPNYITFVCVLYACSQGGFIDDGWKYFRSMAQDHGIEPGEDHYACMVDLLGKSGNIAEAEALIVNMPFQPGLLVWQTLLGACRVHGDVEAGRRAAEHAFALEKKDPSTYVLLSNMFANSSNWDGVGRVREVMDNREVKKMPGSSWIQVMAGDSYPMLFSSIR